MLCILSRGEEEQCEQLEVIQEGSFSEGDADYFISMCTTEHRKKEEMELKLLYEFRMILN